jgi:hypothetical protein
MSLTPTTIDPEWPKIEYDQVNQYARSVYQSMQTLAQMTFVINPALGAGYYYVNFEKEDQILLNVGDFGLAALALAIAFLGFVYNVGALFVYIGSHKCLAALLSRIRQIDTTFSLKLHELLEVTAPEVYKFYWQPGSQKRYSAGDLVTRCFIWLLIILWVIAVLFPFRRFLT